MQGSIIKLDVNLSKRLSELIFEGKQFEYVEDIEFELKNILSQYGINEIDFMNARQLTETVCILKKIDYEKEFIDTGLSASFSTKIVEKFITPKVTDFSNSFDKDAVHNIVIIELNKIVKRVEKELIGDRGETRNDKFSFRFEVAGSGKTGSVKYFVQRNNVDIYCLSAATPVGEKIYLKRFQNIENDLNRNLPPIFKGIKKITSNHKYIPKVAYLNGFYLSELEQVLIIFETYNNETMADK
jgi:hypothetical protein